MNDKPFPADPAPDFDQVTDWVFDLDNTLYPPQIRLFDQIEVKMTAYVMRTLHVGRTEADRLRQHYWQLYGTTLAGLMAEHDLDPVAYMAEVHDISFDALSPAPDLRAAIANLPGRKIVFTNGSAPYAEKVIEARGLNGIFDGLYGVEDANYHPKPESYAFETVFTKAGIRPGQGAMFEDDPRNLAVPHALGMRTVHVGPKAVDAPHIRHHTTDLTQFLMRIKAPRG